MKELSQETTTAAVGSPDHQRTRMTEPEIRFARRAVRRKKLFLALSIVGVVVGLGLAAFYTWQKATQPGYPIGGRFALVIMVLLAGRQQLRQYRYATILEKLGTQFRHADEETSGGRWHGQETV